MAWAMANSRSALRKPPAIIWKIISTSTRSLFQGAGRLARALAELSWHWSRFDSGPGKSDGAGWEYRSARLGIGKPLSPILRGIGVSRALPNLFSTDMPGQESLLIIHSDGVADAVGSERFNDLTRTIRTP